MTTTPLDPDTLRALIEMATSNRERVMHSISRGIWGEAIIWLQGLLDAQKETVVKHSLTTQADLEAAQIERGETAI